MSNCCGLMRLLVGVFGIFLDCLIGFRRLWRNFKRNWILFMLVENLFNVFFNNVVLKLCFVFN